MTQISWIAAAVAAYLLRRTTRAAGEAVKLKICQINLLVPSAKQNFRRYVVSRLVRPAEKFPKERTCTCNLVVLLYS